MDEIHEREGTINQFVGDGVMALFGAPLAYEDHAQRACLSALAVQKALDGFSRYVAENFGVEFKMRMGINSGLVVVGAIGDDLRMDYTAIGDTTNLAARMESMARPGTVLISSQTNEIVRKYFRLKAMGKMEVKGKKQAVETYELIEHIVHRPRLGLERMIYSEMVGRKNELEILELQAVKAKCGQGSVVNIIGEAGIGKSRLVAELKRRNTIANVTLIIGRAISIGRKLSFHSFIDLFKQWAVIEQEDSEIVAFEKLETVVKRICPEDAYEILPFVAMLMGMKLSGRYAERVKGIEGEALVKLIVKNVRELLVKAAKISTLAIVMEDLHWSDDSSIELLEALFRLAAEQKILFINVFRPGHQETGERIVKTLKEKFSEYYVEILLQPLDKKMSESLVKNMLQTWGFPRRIMDQIVERCGGNPFFIEEVVRSLIDEGAIIVKGETFKVTEKIEEVVIPYSINDVLVARIDRLDEKTRNMIKVASVIGRSFFYRILKKVTDTNEGLDTRLTYLKEIQLIQERRRMEELEYLFKHALAQEAAYESILLQKRRDLHLEVAKSMEQVFKERLHQFYGILAYHYGRGEEEEMAQKYLLKAGEEALKSSASSEALHYYREALNLYLKMYRANADSERVASMEKNIALALFYRGQFAESVIYIDKVLKFLGFTDPRNIVSKTTRILSGFCNLLIGLYMPFVKWRNKPFENDQNTINLLFLKATMYTHTDPKRFLIYFASVIRILTRFKLSEIKEGKKIFVMIAPALTWYCIYFGIAGKIIKLVEDQIEETDTKTLICLRFGETLLSAIHRGFGIEKGHYDEALVESSLKIGEFFAASAYLVFFAMIEIERGRFNEAKMLSNKLLEIAETFDNEYIKAIHYEVSIRMYVKFRKLGEVLLEAEEGIPIMEKMEFDALLSYIHGHKAQTQILLKDMEGAAKSLELAKDCEKRAGILPPMWLSAMVLGEFIFALRRLEEAMKTGKKPEISLWQKNALKIGKKEMKIAQKLAQDRTAAYRHIGVYFWLTGRKKKATQWWANSIKEGEKLNARISLSRTYFEVGKRMMEPASDCKKICGLGTEQYLEKAKLMFKTMGLGWDMEELEKVCTEIYGKGITKDKSRSK
jgi:tetratricopeptide (TPR) repeat protein